MISIKVTRYLLTFTCLSSFLLFGAHAQTLPENLPVYVDSILNGFEVPGMSVTIVRNGKVVLAKGFGLKRKGENERVNEHTLFPIASNTKAFTAMALGILVEEGKIKWDDPVVQYLPWFRMSDPWVTSQITVRDLLVHHSGIPAYAGDILLFPPSVYKRQEILERLRDIPLVTSFRTTYAYDNILYLAAGEIIKVVSRQDFEDFVQSRIFDVVGMKESVSRFSNLKNHDNRVMGHLRLHGSLTSVDNFLEQIIGDASNPAGGIASNAVDMARWLITELDSGRTPDQTKLISSSAMAELWKVVTPVPIAKAPASLWPMQPDFLGYALGMRLSNYRGAVLISHGGKLDGFVSHVVLVPKIKLGIAILTNQESTGAYWSLIYQLLDFYLDNPNYPWLQSYLQLTKEANKKWQQEWNKMEIIPEASAPKPTASLKYEGVYRDPFYGNITIKKVGQNLVLSSNETPQFVAPLEPLQYETFIAAFQNKNLKADSWVSFSLLPDGSVEGLKLKVMDPDSDISFEGLFFKKQNTK